jgi:hypothetical protein
MIKITEKTIKRIKAGYYYDLMESIEFLIDTYNEDKYDAGYKSCMENLTLRSYLLAEYIVKKTTYGGIKLPDTAVDVLSKVIEEYFNSLKHE